MIDHVNDFDEMNNHSCFANINDLNEYNRCKHTHKLSTFMPTLYHNIMVYLFELSSSTIETSFIIIVIKQ